MSKIIAFLIAATEPQNAKQIADHLGVSASTARKKLAKLRKESDRLQVEKVSGEMRYSVQPVTVSDNSTVIAGFTFDKAKPTKRELIQKVRGRAQKHRQAMDSAQNFTDYQEAKKLFDRANNRLETLTAE